MNQSRDARHEKLRALNEKIERFAQARHSIYRIVEVEGPGNLILGQRDQLDRAIRFLFEEKRGLLMALGLNRATVITTVNPETFAIWKTAA